MRGPVAALRRQAGGHLAAILLTGSLLWTAPAAAAEDAATLEQRALQARTQAVEALKQGDTAALFAAMDELRELALSGAVVPPGLYFAEADSARSKGDPVRAERAFNDYFKVAEPAGEAHAEAMRAYADFRFRSGLPESAWTVLEDMVSVPAGTLPAGAGRPDTRVSAFSIARRPVTRSQYQAFVDATGREPAAGEVPGCPVAVVDPETDRKAPAVCVSWSDANAYVAWVNANTGLELRLVRAAELQHAQQRQKLDESGGGVSEWTADCALPPDGGEPGGRPCLERAIVPNSAGGGSLVDGVAPVDGRPDTFRADDIGFRLALGS
jgi:formylglycine-generating enzyme required for sulfatase activity